MKPPKAKHPNWLNLVPGSEEWLEQPVTLECSHCKKKVPGPLGSHYDRRIEPCPHCGQLIDYPKEWSLGAEQELPEWWRDSFVKRCTEILSFLRWDPASPTNQLLAGCIERLLFDDILRDFALAADGFATAVAGIDKASIALRKSYEALMAVPERVRELCALNPFAILALSEVMQRLAEEARALRNEAIDGEVLPKFKRQKTDGRPPKDRMFNMLVEIGMLIFLRNGHVPSVSVDPHTGEHVGDFIDFMIPMVRNYKPTEKTCRRAIANIVNAHKTAGKKHRTVRVAVRGGYAEIRVRGAPYR